MSYSSDSIANRGSTATLYLQTGQDRSIHHIQLYEHDNDKIYFRVQGVGEIAHLSLFTFR